MAGEPALPLSPTLAAGSARLAPVREKSATPIAAASHVIDLRQELTEESAPVSRLGQPLPARVVSLTPGKVEFDLVDVQGDCFGLLVLEGLLLAEADAGRAHAGWLIGAHDLIRPSAMHGFALTEHTHWRALVASRVALLDHPFGLRAGGIPLVSRVLVARATRTLSWLFAKSLILGSPVIEERLLLLFALLGERWGRMTSDGVSLSLPLTHAMLAALCGARRPSVTLALHSLERAGLVSAPAKGTWLLHRELARDTPCRASCAAEYAHALGLDW
jgi:CRP-like cAMP-binding protein